MIEGSRQRERPGMIIKMFCSVMMKTKKGGVKIDTALIEFNDRQVLTCVGEPKEVQQQRFQTTALKSAQER